MSLRDSALWVHIVESDSTATIGLRTPGSLKGFEKGRVVISPQAWASAKAAIRNQVGVVIVREDDLIPWVRVRIKNAGVLRSLREIPFVEYVEPAFVVAKQIPLWAFGCSYDAFTGPVAYLSSGDILPVTYQRMRIDRAWAYSRGVGVSIGLTDTGADEWQYELGTGFTSGESGGRSISRGNTDGTFGQANPQCSHGTRLAGVVAAPKNGASIVGVAWGASLVSIKHSDAVFAVDAADAQLGIRLAATAGARVILMAWQSLNWMNAVQSEIEYWYYYGRDRVFVGAAGTTECYLHQNNIVFPAEMNEVLAVSAAELDNSRPCKAHYGPELDVIAYHGQPTTGSSWWGAQPVRVEQSSNAAGVVAGVAALVRGRYPQLTNGQVMDRIIATSGTVCSMPNAWHLLVNAEAAVGGLCPSLSSNPPAVTFSDGSPTTIAVTVYANVTGGNGPIEILWNNGQSGASATYSVTDFGYDYHESFGVTIRDTGASNPPLAMTHTIQVNNRRCPAWNPETPCAN